MIDFETYTDKYILAKQDPTEFSVGDVVFFNFSSGEFEKALDSSEFGISGLVHTIVTTGASGCFLIQREGLFDWASHGKDIGVRYYASGSVAGTLVKTKPNANSRMFMLPLSADKVLIGDDKR